MSRKLLATVGVALLLVTAGCAGSLNPAASANAQTDQTNGTDRSGNSTISVSASGQVEAEPDQAVLQVAVLASGDDANAVREQVAQNVTRMREALRNAGIADDQIRTVQYSIDQQYREENGERRPDGFQGVHAFEITLSNVSRAGPVIDAAVSNGADRVQSVQLTLSEERRREVRADALRNAMDNARADADVIAESANLTVSGVHTVSTGDVGFSSVRAEALTAQSDAGTQIESGPVTVTAQVSVTYNATG
ncbi:SIMPL domain-containing protein [Halorussus gelatinilyticus]|uniref:SIMPL domain-containing protein n=1 Tax=Halorussus gelatinilyticus TaxID=2937524 RepID=A0A8U0IQ76_9EURY|nr:SIMPL domain-containing protein [Halorussus gelatinilyticus]UPW02159.1 SIMPL domain-containing protein [Halorussus gelatinilyticus]